MKKVFCVVFVLVCVFLAVLPAYAAVNWSDYSSSNVIPLPFNFADVGETIYRNGLTIEVLEDGSIHIEGTSTGSTVLVLANITNLTVGDTYYWNYYFKTEAPPTPAFYVDVGEITATWNSISRNTIFVAKQARYQVYCEVNSGYTVNFTVNVIMAKSPTPVEYQPYIPFYVVQNSVYNVFEGATIDVVAQGDDDGNIYYDVQPMLTPTGMSLYNLWSLVSSMTNPDSVHLEITVKFPQDKTFIYDASPIYVTAPTSVLQGSVSFYSGGVGYLEMTGMANTTNVWVLQNTSSYPTIVRSIFFELSAGTAKETFFTTFFAAYQQGYSSGYQQGARSSNENIYNEGKAEGYRNGFIEGKAEGLQLSQTGDWRNLISAVLEAPVNTFQSLFSFEVLGMDMRAAIGAILALCVLLIIIKKVVL